MLPFWHVYRNSTVSERFYARLSVDELYRFDWPLDTAGYELELVDGHQIIRARGGPLRYYAPLEEQPGLWRKFADMCTDSERALQFVIQHGLLDHNSSELLGRHNERASLLLGTARMIRSICDAMDSNDRKTAAEIFSSNAAPRVTAILQRNDQSTQFEFKLTPITLRGALLLQAGQAIAGDRKFKRCQNDECTEWFQLGPGANTKRRQYCGDACRVAANRREKALSG
jgi:hypothetical protein